MNRIRAFPGVAAFARSLVAKGVPVAIASGSSPLAIERTLVYAGLDDLFPVRVSSVDVPEGKPAPVIFLEAARRLGVDPARCLVLEDSVPGVQSAKAAGMACIALSAPIAQGNIDDGHGTIPSDLERAGADKDLARGFALADLVVVGGAACFVPAMAEQAWRFG
jgi:beta-phosphoglucomutase-like phosphatase (HAD superfamily)